jgi:hypothetical protein
LLDLPLGRIAEPKFKRPLNFVVSSLRMLDADTDGGSGVQEALARMGQLPFAWATPDGPTDEAAPWKGGLVSRWQFALDLMTGRLNGTRAPLEAWMHADEKGEPISVVDRFATLLLGSTPSEPMRRALQPLVSDDGSLLVAGILASPAFQWR